MKKSIIASCAIIIATMAAISTAKAAQPVVELDQHQFTSQILNFGPDGTVERRLSRPTVVDFWAPWCGPCRRLSPIIDSLSTKYAGQVDFVKVNIDNNPELARTLRISSIPLVIFIPTDSVKPITGALGLQPDSVYQSQIDLLLK